MFTFMYVFIIIYQKSDRSKRDRERDRERYIERGWKRDRLEIEKDIEREDERERERERAGEREREREHEREREDLRKLCDVWRGSLQCRDHLFAGKDILCFYVKLEIFLPHQAAKIYVWLEK